jgi:hypothetical protein
MIVTLEHDGYVTVRAQSTSEIEDLDFWAENYENCSIYDERPRGITHEIRFYVEGTEILPPEIKVRVDEIIGA